MKKTGVLHFKGRDKVSVEVVLEDNSIKVLNHDTLDILKYDQLSLEIGGANNHLFFFKPQHSKDYSLQLNIDHDLSSFIKSLGRDSFNKIVSKHKRAKTLFTSLVLISFLTIGLILFALIQSRSFLADRIAKSIPYETEQLIGERLVSVMIPPSKSIRKGKVQEELEKMLAPLVKVLPKEFQEMNFFIADDKNLNAFAMPGGNIVLNRGLLEKADSDIEVLGVVAHEMAHVTQRHVLRSMIQGVGIFLLIQTMLGDMTGLIAVLGDQGSFLLSRSFSRDMETEADKVGFQYLMAAKIPPEGLIAFFKKIILESEKVLGKELSKVNISFLSTHPDTEKRISEIENMIKREKSQFHYKSDYLTKIKTQLKGEK